MSEIALARINSFAYQAEQVNAQSSEEPIFVLSSSQLQDLISRVVLEATEPLYKEIAYDRQRIAKLEQKEPQPLQKDRGEILRALLAANNGKMLAKDARQKMHLSKTRFSLLVASLKDYIEVKSYHLDKRQSVIILKSELVSRN
jgi:uncharacterized membrane protein